MGAADSKLSFKKSVFRLAEEKGIPVDDPYWRQFWELPETAEDVFALFSPADIRRTRDTCLDNLETLIAALTSRLFALCRHPAFPDPEAAPEREALNCVRVLTRLLPYLYETDALEAWEERFFWTPRTKPASSDGQNEVIFDESNMDASTQPPEQPVRTESVKPLAEELVDTLLDMLFYAGFTVPVTPVTGKTKVTYAIWQSGVGCNTSMAITKESESNRIEILRLLIAVTSKAMYIPSNTLPVRGTRALTYLVTNPDKRIVLSVLCSLLNTTLKYNAASWRLPYDHVVFSDSRRVLVTYSLHMLLILLLYPIPEGRFPDPQPKNNFRHYLGRLHRTQDFQFLVDGMTRVLNQPIQASTSYLPGSQKSLKWAPETIMLFWESLQCNKRFRTFLIETDRSLDFVVLLIYYALEYQADASKSGVVRMCVFVLQTLSSEPKFGKSLNKKFENQNLLPPSVRIPGFNGSYAEYVIQSIYNLITSSKGRFGAIYPPLLAIISNVAPYVQNLSSAASTKLVQLFTSMSSPSFLLANESNHALLHSLLEAMNSIIEHQYSSNPSFIYAILRSHKRFENLRSFTLDSGKAEIEKQRRLRKDSASDIMQPLESPSLSRSNTARSVTDSASAAPADPDTFTIGDSDDSDAESTPRTNRSSVAMTPTSTTFESRGNSIDDAVPIQLRGMSEKARGKLPMGQLSRQNSALSIASHSSSMAYNPAGEFAPSPEWIETWLPLLPLHTILTVIQELSPQLRAVLSKQHSRQSSITSQAGSISGQQQQPQPPQPQEANNNSMSMLERIRTTEIPGVEPSVIKCYTFEWSSMALGWYESLLWGLIFVNEMTVGRGTVGVWNGTAVRLFRVQETAPEGPSLRAPKGAVDAVASTLIDRLSHVNLSALSGGATGNSAPSNGAGAANTAVQSRRSSSAADREAQNVRTAVI
ncbi:hypothetical protein DRE_07692 [Drechslerella stenobrocha 248]|uniref:High-temperature-induced dauer-formation protein n=1 Tax=Drechslerella stenobrocha 248 TaxID=1043628 RepID=W7HTV7_9PEZI|nr:hypothetical protein DRE_07692 [Drechslerella stenobrocha 248]